MIRFSKYTLWGFVFLAFVTTCLTWAAIKYESQSPRAPASTGLDFNQMIEESQKDTAELNAQFQKNAGIQKKILNAGKLSEESKAIPVTPEQFAAKSSADVFANTVETKLDDKAEMKRLSRELQEVEN